MNLVQKTQYLNVATLEYMYLFQTLPIDVYYTYYCITTPTLKISYSNVANTYFKLLWNFRIMNFYMGYYFVISYLHILNWKC